MGNKMRYLADNVYNTVIVGGGIAGLTSAAYLSKKGQRVLLIEKNKECGGLVNTFSRNGFHFDTGVRALLDAGIIFPMLKELNIELEVLKSPVSVGVGKEFLNVKDLGSLEDYKKLLVKTYPKSEEEIDDLIKVILKIMKNMDVLYGVENPIIKDVWKEKEYIFKTLLPWLPKFLFTIRKINSMNMPVEEYLETIIKNTSLRDIISQHFFKNTPTFFALSYFSLYLDYFYPKGGVGKLSEAIENKLLETGGKIITETTVCKVNASQRSVTDQNNTEYKYDNLIWAADLKTFYKITVTNGLSNRIQGKFEEAKIKMLERRGGDSIYTLFVEVDEPLESFKRISTGHFFYTPSKLGLGETHRKELKQMLHSWDTLTKEQVIIWLDKFTRLNTYEISIPGLKDPDLAPKGKTGLIISFLAEYDLFQKIHQAGWSEKFIIEIEKHVLKVLSDSVYPMLKEKIISQFSFTPLSIKNRIGSSEGAITGWSFEEPIPVINKMQQSARSVSTPIPSIFQAGQWTYSPAGVPMCILTGKMAADKALKKK